ncbi:MAG TPA: amino acid synthesis family protein [Thermodesulfobacteriota bacterium]|nr:amino acid synthesis family protein [Thermodesulfobacteriota bacterium]
MAGGDATPFRIRKLVTVVEEVLSEAGIPADRPLRRVAAIAVVANPYAGRYEPDLSAAVAFSAELGARLGRMAVAALGERPESYGKGAIAGLAGEQEHANAFLTTAFGDALREAVGGGKAWIASNTKRGVPGASLDVPLAYKDALYVRSHYDTMEVRVPDAPLPDEVVVVAVVANRGRLNARLGGLAKEEVRGLDGLR